MASIHQEAFHAGFRVGTEASVREDREACIEYVVDKALTDVLDEDIPGPVRWRAGEFLLGFAKGLVAS